MLVYEIANVRDGGQYSVAGCDINLGYEEGGKFIGVLAVRNVWLREKKAGGYFVSWPSAARIRNGAIVVEEGKPKYDNHVGLFGFIGANPKRAGDWSVASQAWDFQQAIVDELLALSKAAAKVESGRGTRTPAKAAGSQPATRATARAEKPAAVRAAKPAAVVHESFEEDGDDDLPF